MNAVKELGKRLAARLDEDDWGYIEPFLNECETELESLRQQLAECHATNGKLREALGAVQQVANRSEGIAGWHLNGDIASWDSILPEVDEALALPNDATALSELIAERTASLTAEVERLKDCWSAEGAQVNTLRQQNAELTAEIERLNTIINHAKQMEELDKKQNAELTAQRDAAISTIEFAYKVAVEHDDRIPFDWVAYCGMLHAAIINHKEQDENRSE